MTDADEPWKIVDLTGQPAADHKATFLADMLARLLELDADILLIAALPPVGPNACPNTRTFRFSPPERIATLRDAAARFVEKHKDV